jgi:hypothetical protein
MLIRPDRSICPGLEDARTRTHGSAGHIQLPTCASEIGMPEATSDICLMPLPGQRLATTTRPTMCVIVVCMQALPPAQPRTDIFNLNGNRHFRRTQTKTDWRLQLKSTFTRIDFNLVESAGSPSRLLMTYSTRTIAGASGSAVAVCAIPPIAQRFGSLASITPSWLASYCASATKPELFSPPISWLMFFTCSLASWSTSSPVPGWV